jgi:hypothetical protein
VGGMEDLLTEGDFSFKEMHMLNPSAAAFSSASAMGVFRRVTQDVRIDISFVGAASMAARCLMGVAMYASQDSDVGDMLERMTRADMSKLQEGVSVLRSADLIAASHELAAVLRVSKHTLEIKDADKRKLEMSILQGKIQTLIHDAQLAFSKVETIQEKIRSIQIIITAQVLSAAGGERDEESIRCVMGCVFLLLLPPPPPLLLRMCSIAVVISHPCSRL